MARHTAAVLTGATLAVVLLSLSDAAPRVKRQGYGQAPYNPTNEITPTNQYNNPTNQYPTNQYNPTNQYPTNQYPTNQYPANQPTANGFRCPQPDGQFPYDRDCSRFYQCDGGVATVADCQNQLVFNAQVGYCDWPANVPNCPRSANTQQLLKPDVANLCTRNPYGGNPTESFQVRHPRFCNAYYTCTTGYLYGQCSFCPQGTYFNRLAGGCRNLPAGILDTSSVCDGLELVSHADKVYRRMDEECWPFANRENPWQAIADDLRNRRPGGYNQRYNPNTSSYNPNTSYDPNTSYNPSNTYNPSPNYQG